MAVIMGLLIVALNGVFIYHRLYTQSKKVSVILHVWYFKSQVLHAEQKRVCDTPSMVFQITGSALRAKKSL